MDLTNALNTYNPDGTYNIEVTAASFTSVATPTNVYFGSKPSVNAGSSIDYGNQIIPKLNVTGLTQTDVTNSFGTPEEVTLYFDDSANADTYYIYILKNGETAPDFSDSNNPPAATYTETRDASKVTSETYALDITALVADTDATEYDVYVIGDNLASAAINPSEVSDVFEFSRMAQITGLETTEQATYGSYGALIWDAADNAYVNGSNAKVDTITSKDYYPFDNGEIADGATADYRVVNYGDGEFMSGDTRVLTSLPVDKTVGRVGVVDKNSFTLYKGVAAQITGYTPAAEDSDYILAWDKVGGSLNYTNNGADLDIVELDNGQVGFIIAKADVDNSRTVSVSIKAVSDTANDVLGSNASATSAQYITTAVPVATYAANTLTWNTITGANGYEIALTDLANPSVILETITVTTAAPLDMSPYLVKYATATDLVANVRVADDLAQLVVGSSWSDNVSIAGVGSTIAPAIEDVAITNRPAILR